jgi:hypothetical protein
MLLISEGSGHVSGAFFFRQVYLPGAFFRLDCLPGAFLCLDCLSGAFFVCAACPASYNFSGFP